ncbi:ABC transporter ATP-binding protein [Paenibacillus crassostreae]|uniref:ABC transporter ATP-binding protein n=1 Tax=Paenibacillus crassostreae TaxID=1763538 RepID=A0A167GIG9_9BACL|nr:ABC transporter ATP-binding protein [Paenibacillus crassostreae]AOZ92141.1 ABC transporter ATP-binding protein [Paenibacillus crassostreae]OAB77602.1 ABC transporter ATP-binding protein [Paenibacillus crassostreae]
MIEVNEVSKTYGDLSALQNVSWTIEEGEWWGIIGPNGSGKSTLLQLISGVDKISSGELKIRGRHVSKYNRRELSQMVAVLQQDGLPAIHYPVRDIVEMGRFPFQDWLGREQNKNTTALVDDIMNRLHLTDLGDRPLDELSGGQRQRVALGKVMAQEPQILLLDEPTSFLDIYYQLQFMELVANWRQDSGITIVAVLHDLNLAAQFCDKLLVLREGEVVGVGTPDEILTEDNIRRVYEVDPAVVKHPVNGVPQILLSRQ